MDLLESMSEWMGPYLPGLLITAGLGFLLGLERQFDKNESADPFAGIRTFPIVAICGYMIGYVRDYFDIWIVVVSLPAFLIFISVTHLARARSEIMGITTTVSLIATFVLGILVSIGYIKESLATAVVIVTLLAMKEKLHGMMHKITQEEMYAVVRFLILALLIIPFLPETKFGPDGMLNPFKIGMIVLIISLVNFLGYFLVKFAGPGKGILFASIIGGLFSSTAVAWDFSSRSKETPELSEQYAAGIIISSSIMFLRLLLISSLINFSILSYMWIPFGGLFLMCIIPGIITVRNSGKLKIDELKMGNPLNIVNAIGFTLMLIAIMMAVHYAKEYIGTGGLIVTGLLSGLADTDAITISMSSYASETGMSTAAMVILIAALSNMMMKLLITVSRATAKTSKKVSIAFIPATIAGIFFLVLRYYFLG